jgi:phosphotriesterase-related protein
MGHLITSRKRIRHNCGSRKKLEKEIALAIARDILVGVDATGIRAGLIGEVGCSWPLANTQTEDPHPRAQRMTGAPLMIHPGRNPVAPFEIVKILDDAGAELSRTILCHRDRRIDEPARLAELAATGCMLEYELFCYEHSYYPESLPIAMPNDLGRRCAGSSIRAIWARSSYLTTSAARTRGSATVGAGYAHSLEKVVPLMRAERPMEEEISAILARNPQHLSSFV